MTSTIARNAGDATRVGIGGMLGVLARYGLSELMAISGSWPWDTFLINVAGAFFLGALTSVVSVIIADPARRRSIQLCLGPGFLGGFTTYSALAFDTFDLLRSQPLIGSTYIMLSLVLGVLSAWAGLSFGRHAAHAVRSHHEPD